MFLIIEGIHDAGKSTLSSNICSEIPSFKTYIGKRQFPELTDAKFSNVSDFALGTNCAVVWFAKYFSVEMNVIFDRLHFSEYAYSIVKRKVNEDEAISKFKIIDSQLSDANVKLIFLRCDYESMISRAKQKNNVYSANDYFDLMDRFNEALNMTTIDLEIIDTDINSKDIVFEKAISFIKEE